MRRVADLHQDQGEDSIGERLAAPDAPGEDLPAKDAAASDATRELPAEDLLEESLPQESLPQESLPQEALPQEALPEEALPEESSPPETLTAEPPADVLGEPGCFGLFRSEKALLLVGDLEESPRRLSMRLGHNTILQIFCGYIKMVHRSELSMFRCPRFQVFQRILVRLSRFFSRWLFHFIGDC